MLRTCKFDMCIVVLNYYGEDRPNHTTQQERYGVAPWDRAPLIRIADALPIRLDSRPSGLDSPPARPASPIHPDGSGLIPTAHGRAIQMRQPGMLPLCDPWAAFLT